MSADLKYKLNFGNLKYRNFLFVVLTLCQVQYLGPVQEMELSHQTQKEMTCPSQGQIVPDGIHDLMYRQCTCCPTLQALSVLDRSKSANLGSNMAIILKLSITSSFHQHNISDTDPVSFKMLCVEKHNIDNVKNNGHAYCTNPHQ